MDIEKETVIDTETEKAKELGVKIGAKTILVLKDGNDKEVFGYLRKITRKEISMMTTMSQKTNAFDAVGLVLKSILMPESDTQILTDDDLFYSACQSIQPLLIAKEGNLISL